MILHHHEVGTALGGAIGKSLFGCRPWAHAWRSWAISGEEVVDGVRLHGGNVGLRRIGTVARHIVANPPRPIRGEYVNVTVEGDPTHL